jgi:hypothetical protein
MYCDILRNPIIVGILVGVVVYFFLKYKNEKKIKKRKEKDKNKNPPLAIPVIAAIVTGFLVWSFDGSKSNTPDKININKEIKNTEPGDGILKDINVNDIAGGNSNIIKDIGTINPNAVNIAQVSDKMESYQLIGKGIQVPTNLPDAFLDMDLF